MHLSGISIALLIVFGMMVVQSLCGMTQIKDYRRAVSRMHKLGNVGMGQRRGKFLNGHVVIIACDQDGIITGAEALDGIAAWSKFHPIDKFMDKKLVGSSIFDFLAITETFDKKQFKRHQGYVRAFEALEVRLTDRELTREQEIYMEKKKKKKGLF